MKNRLDMDDWLRSKGIKALEPVDEELVLADLRAAYQEIGVISTAINELLADTNRKLSDALTELRQRDQTIVVWTQRYEREMQRRVAAEMELVACRELMMACQGKLNGGEPIA